MRGPQCWGATGPQGSSPEASQLQQAETRWQVPSGPSAFTAPGPCSRGSRLNHVAGVIQLKNNLPLWGYFYPGISPLHQASTQTHTQPLGEQVQQLGERKQASLLPGWDKR